MAVIIDITDLADLKFADKRDVLVERVKASDWRDSTPYPHTFDRFLSELEEGPLPQAVYAWIELEDLAVEDGVEIRA